MSAIWTPRADQRIALDFIEDRDQAAIWAGCGSGKTALGATWLERVLFDRCAGRRVLIVAPDLVARYGWIGEFAKWKHLSQLSSSVRVLTFGDLGLTGADLVIDKTKPGAKPKRVPKGSVAADDTWDVRRSLHTFVDKKATKRHLQALQERIHLCSWHAYDWIVQAYGTNWPYDVVVYDESSFLKDASSGRATASRYIVQKLGAVQFQLQQTATPASDHVEALYSQMDILQPGLLPLTLTQFRSEYLKPKTMNGRTGQVYSWEVRPECTAPLTAKLGQVAISIPDALGIETLQVEQPIEMPESARRAYDAMKRTWVYDGITAGSEAVVWGKLSQMASGFVYRQDLLERDAVPLHQLKTERLLELMEAIDGQVLIAFAFEEEYRRLKSALGKHVDDIRVAGSLDRFKMGALRSLAVHPKSAGHGVDGMQMVTNQIIWMSVPTSGELFTQTNGRLRRSGATFDTMKVHMLYARNTVEEQIMRDVLPGKRTMQELILDGVRARETELG